MSSARNAPSPTVVILGSISTVDASTSAAERGAERPQPHRRDQAGVEREQQGAGVVHQPLGRPHLPADPAAHRVVPLAQPDPEQPHARPASAAPGRRTSSARRAAPQRSAPAAASPSVAASRTPTQITSSPLAAATSGRQASSAAVRPYDRHPAPAPRGAPVGPAVARGADRTPPGSRAQSSPGGTDREHGRARAHLGVLPDPGARARGCCAARRWRPRRPGPGRRAARRRRASGRSGRPRARSAQPLPRVSRPVTGGSACRSTSRPTLAPSARA